jgi:hypothetical protein
LVTSDFVYLALVESEPVLDRDLAAPLSLRILLVSVLAAPVSAGIRLMPPVSLLMAEVSDMWLVSLIEPVSLPAAPLRLPREPLHPATSATATRQADACAVHFIGYTSPVYLAYPALEGRT